MRKPRTPVVIPILVGIYLLASFALTGCNKTTADAPQAGASDQFADAKTVFAANCAKCHSVGGESPGGGNPAGPGPGGPGPGGPGGGKKGPSLAKVGADAKHTRDWLADHIRDPEKHKPGSKMPKFAGKLKDNDILALAEYLVSLK